VVKCRGGDKVDFPLKKKKKEPDLGVHRGGKKKNISFAGEIKPGMKCFALEKKGKKRGGWPERELVAVEGGKGAPNADRPKSKRCCPLGKPDAGGGMIRRRREKKEPGPQGGEQGISLNQEGSA